MRIGAAPIALILFTAALGALSPRGPIATVFVSSAWAQAAQEAPFLVLRIQSEMGFRLQDRKAGLGGAVYVLNRAQPRADTRTQSVQVAYDARNRPTLLRLTQRIDSNTAGQAFIDAARQSIARVQPKGIDAPVDLIKQALAEKPSQPIALPLSGGRSGSVSYLADRNIAVLDIPIAVADARALDEQDLRDRLSDATLTFEETEAGDGATVGEHRRYHGPDGRFGGGAVKGVTIESGSWSLDPNGLYCIDSAPTGDTSCGALYEIDGDGLYLAIRDGETTTVNRVSVQHGNPGDFATPRRADAVPQAVAEMIVRGQTEDRRYPNGGRASLYMMRDGTFRGIRDGEPSDGTWTILKDGRRCLTETETGESECLFLSETDGGTFRLFDLDRSLRGEAVYRDGNPEGY
ncbi:hypothetical protein HH303_06720 [Rhodospirillaceae bacterium KN72]|uniref:Uncharacterized protein n=1 Tax=Pacificispira spongiicola TaxID=2729598 RepID=A0A7Y0DYY0_9PROT|nr:hypothetical protein [Pacificispira spongiicola]NMM44162.1 hypothetical protein [Pacificispira spongiicola]